MAEIFPHHRREALQELLHYIEGCYPLMEIALHGLVDHLSSPQRASLLMPEDGQFVKYTTPTALTLSNCRLPHPYLILEYAMSAPQQRTPNGDYPSATILMVEAKPDRDIILLNLKRREQPVGGRYWRHTPVMLVIDKDTQVEVSNTGEVYGQGFKPLNLPGWLYADKGLPILPSYYAAELRVLAQLSMICNSANITLEKIPAPSAAPAPDECYVLKCTGPTELEWLPGCGMLAASDLCGLLRN